MKYLYLQSALHQDEELRRQAQDLFDQAGRKLGMEMIPGSAAEVGAESVCLVYVATGGTAGLAKAALADLKGPVVLVTIGSQNSLSASMETLTYITQQGKTARLLHGSQDEVVDSICTLVRAAEARRSLRGMKLGLIGAPSDWLISTAVDYGRLKEQLGIEVVSISMEELVEEIRKNTYPDSPACQELLSRPFDREQVEQALAIYGAFRRLVDKYGLAGFSVRCFDLLTLVKNTGCLGLALLNAEGIYAGCEGDLPSLISMVILGRISGQHVFQCNPSRVDRAGNEIVFAHCTLPLDMPERYTLDTHFESGIGVAIAGDIPLGKVTVFKASADLGHYFLSAGEIVEDLHERDLCRTQIRLRCQEPVEDFLNSHVGNHYLVCLGDYTEAIRAFFDKD